MGGVIRLQSTYSDYIMPAQPRNYVQGFSRPKENYKCTFCMLRRTVKAKMARPIIVSRGSLEALAKQRRFD